MGARSLSRVTRETLREYRVWLDGRASVQTLAHILSDARCLFYWCEDRECAEYSRIPRKLLPRIQERSPDRLTDEESEAVLGVPEPYRFCLRFLLGTGLRWGEFARAQVADVRAGVLTVKVSTSRKVRRVPVPEDLLAEPGGRVGRVSPSRHSERFSRMVRKLSGAEHFHVRRTRHTFACTWPQRGGSLAALQACSGARPSRRRRGRRSDDPVRREVAPAGKSGAERMEDRHSGAANRLCRNERRDGRVVEGGGLENR